MKKLDERRLKAIALYYYSGSETCGKMIPSCIKAGYTESTANRDYSRILEIDSITDRDWRDLNNLLPLLIRKAKVWLEKHPEDTDTKDIRQVWTGIRLIGDAVGKFIKREEKVTHNIDEKRAVVVFQTQEQERKYWAEIVEMGKQRIKAIDVEVKNE